MERTTDHRSDSLRVAVSGARGLVGSALGKSLQADGGELLPLVRRPARDDAEIHYDIAAGRIESEKLEGLDAVVHLAGENIAARRWSAEQKRRIRDSRVDSTALIARALAGLARPPAVWVAASAIGYYGNRGDEAMDESAAPGEGFLSETCVAWEQAAAPAVDAGVRVVHLRIGVVLARGGGALSKMLTPFRLGLGGRIGSGRQMMSWVALDDLVSMIRFAIGNEALRGAVNAVAPGVVTNAEFTRALGRVLGRPTLFPVPAAVIGLTLGEMGRELLLGGARVVPKRLQDAGFRFRFEGVEEALRHLLQAPPSI